MLERSYSSIRGCSMICQAMVGSVGPPSTGLASMITDRLVTMAKGLELRLRVPSGWDAIEAHGRKLSGGTRISMLLATPG